MTDRVKPHSMNWNAYHFVGETLRDGSPIPDNGVTLKHEGPLELCRSGFHASREVWQALDYAPGHTLCRVHCTGELIEGDDKLVCRERTIIARIDAEEVLFAFARSCARDVLHLWDAPQVVVDFLETGDPALRDEARDMMWQMTWNSARDVAWDAARAVARGAARGAARDAARDAARAVSRFAPQDAAKVASWAAVSAVAWDATQKKQRARLTRMVTQAFEAIDHKGDPQ